MGILDKILGKKDKDHDHAHDHHGHEHIDCPKCGKHFHTRAELDAHTKSAHK